MRLTPEQRAENKRQRFIESAKGMSARTYIKKYVAKIFQRMIRAEIGAKRSQWTRVVLDGKMDIVYRRVGQCVCVTCGKVAPWTNHAGTMQTGHFLAGRRNSIVFEEDGVAPQCEICNHHGGGMVNEYRKWMIEVRGLTTVERLERLKETSVKFTDDELADMRIAYAARLKAAIERMETT